MKFRLDKWHHFFLSVSFSLDFHWKRPLLYALLCYYIFKFTVIFTECPFIIYKIYIATFAWKMHKPFERKFVYVHRKWWCAWALTPAQKSNAFTVSWMGQTMSKQTVKVNEWNRQYEIDEWIYKIMHHFATFCSIYFGKETEWMFANSVFRAHIVNATHAPFLLFNRAQKHVFHSIFRFSCHHWQCILDESQLQRVALQKLHQTTPTQFVQCSENGTLRFHGKMF